MLRAREIFDRAGQKLYLRRWYLYGMPRMSDGSWPFDARGGLRSGSLEASKLGVYVHCIHRSDSERELHNHPFKWCLSFILRGGYWEERRVRAARAGGGAGGGWHVVRRRVRPFTFNFIRSSDFHRVDLINGKPSWSLFIVGPRFQGWGFWSRFTGRFTPWRQFIAAKRAAGKAGT